MQVLRLEAVEFAGPDRWRWVLTGAGGEFLADHQVDLTGSEWELEAFTDLPRYLRWHVAPDRRLAGEAEILARVGAWAGERLLGPVGAALADAAPAVARVVVPADPPQAARLLGWPLELAHAGGRPVGRQDVTLVFQHGDEVAAARLVAGVGERLRVLGLFSLPAEGRPLNLRRERHALVRLFGEIAGAGRATDVRVLQYGVTRERLRQVLEEAEGWDVIHVSGHGLPGELELETADGQADRISASELADLLAVARERVKLVTVSACWSAAMTLAEQRRLLRLAGPLDTRDAADLVPDSATTGELMPDHGAGQAGDAAEALDSGTERAGAADDMAGAAGGLAGELTARLRCAVLAMRYPVTDGFAIGLAERFYELVAGKGQPVARALGIALADPAVVADPPTWDCPALSGVTPALSGTRAVTLTLAAPERAGPASFDAGLLKLAGFPAQPERFVGRTSVMARASAALAPRSGVPCVVLHGMPGGGKTACALELAYGHEGAFEALAWFKAPDEDQDIADALTRFAITLERSLPGLRMAHLLDDQAALDGFLPGLTELLENRRILIIVDNAESLLSEAGQWRDRRWAAVARALTGHGGAGRVIITSRRVPDGLDSRARVMGVDALSLDEALLLARELPHLSTLIDGKIPGIDPGTARDLAAGVLEMAQGHPKLLELADGRAAQPGRLRTAVDAAGEAWRAAGGVPDGFFATGQTTAGGQDFWHVLGAWTRAAADGLTPAARDLFCLLCCLEEPDRARPVLDGNWAGLWQRQGRPGQPPDLDTVAGEVAAAALATAHGDTAQEHATEYYGVHPGVAAAGRELAGQEFRTAADAGLAAFWASVAQEAVNREGEQDTGGLVIRAGLGAAPYLLRLGAWDQAHDLLDLALIRDHSRAAAGAALPALRAIAAAVADTSREPAALSALARALERVDPQVGERQMTAALAAALDQQDYQVATVTVGYLVSYHMRAGRLAEALRLAEDKADYTRRAGLGPWTQLADHIRRLQILNMMGQAQHVLGEVRRFRGQMDALPATSAQPEAHDPWNVREVILDTGREAARQLGRWDQALELSAAAVASKRGRGTPDSEIARVVFNDYFPLLRLGRLDDAVSLLTGCRDAFEAVHDIDGLGMAYGALADAEDKRGHGDVAIGMARDAIRYNYLARNLDAIQVSHHNLGTYLYRHAEQPAEALAHHLASALLCGITGTEGAQGSVQAAIGDLRAAAGEAALPADVATLCAQAGQVPGVYLDRLLAALTPVPDAADQALRELADQVRKSAVATTRSDLARYLARWDPVIAGLVAAARGDAEAGETARDYLAGYAGSPDWANLATALTRLLDHQQGPGPDDELDDIDAAILTRAQDALAGRVSVPVQLWPAMGLGPLLGDTTVAARGDGRAAVRARDGLNALAAQPDLAALAAALEQILGGNRDPALASALGDPTQQAIVACVLEHIDAADPGQ